MLESIPTRREPRLLVAVLGAYATRYVVIDAWECRAVGRLPEERRALRLSLWRVVIRSAPSHLLLVLDARFYGRPVLRFAREVAVRRGLPLVTLDRQESLALAAEAPAGADLLQSYPELRHLLRGPRDPVLRAVRVALGALSTRSLPPRRYVPGLASSTAPRVDA